MSNCPKVSWLMPVYNAGKYLSRAMDSMLQQTMQDFEIIIVMEHGCEDNTEKICDGYAKKDPRIKIIKNNVRLGIAISLNIGLEMAKGKYIARMDADDYSYPTRLEKQCKYMDEHSDVGILCTNRKVVCDGSHSYNSDHPTGSEEISARLLFGFCLNHPSMMMRADLMREKRWKYPVDREAEDFGLCAELVKYTKIACLGEVLLDYHEHGDNAIYSRFSAVRQASAYISKKALHDRLGIDDIYDYDDIYFGWRELDVPKNGYKEYLCGAFNLFKKIYMANKKINLIDENVFCAEINRQWKITIDSCRLGFLMYETDFIKLIEYSDIENFIENVIGVFSDIFSCESKIAIWGTGKHCEETLKDMDNDYPFNIECFIDSNVEKRNKLFFGRKIIVPENLDDFDFIAIGSPRYKSEIYRILLEELGIPLEKIFNLPDRDLILLMKNLNKSFSHKDEPQGYIFLAPDYGNLGDHAIVEAEKEFLENMGICVHEIPADNFFKYAFIMQCTSRSKSPIFITGGGFFGSLWYEHYHKVEEIIKMHPDNPIIVFPQTLYWDVEKDYDKINQSMLVFSQHKNVTICARDFVSYMMMKKYYTKNRILLVPDMVLSKKWKEFCCELPRYDRAILCLKEDKESILSDEQHACLKILVSKYYDEIIYCNTDKAVEIQVSERKSYLKKVFEEFRSCKLVITDRLHGMVFAAITETPCLVLDNCNHKLRYTYEWLRDLPYIKFIYDFETIENVLTEISSIVCDYSFDNDIYFSELKNIIRQQYNLERR